MIFYILLFFVVVIAILLFYNSFESYCKWCFGRQRYPKLQESIYSTIYYRPRKYLNRLKREIIKNDLM